MSAMAEKLKDAGADTVGAQLTAACIEAIRRHPESAEEAWRLVGVAFGHEFIRGLMSDMRVTAPQREQSSPPPPFSRDNHAMATPTPYRPRVIPPERLEKRRELQQIVRSKYKNSGNVPWSEVGWHELPGMRRDGKEADALLAAGPANAPNTGCSVGEVLGVKRTDEIIAGIRG